MRIYKTWQVVKMLGENPNLKFKHIGRNTVLINFEGFIDFQLGSVRSALSPDDKWELIKESIGVLEAVKAFTEGKTIVCNLNGENNEYKPSGNIVHFDSDFCLINQECDPVGAKEILEGKWYIKNNIEEESINE